jgi:hypothetical protein
VAPVRKNSVWSAKGLPSTFGACSQHAGGWVAVAGGLVGGWTMAFVPVDWQVVAQWACGVEAW